MTSAEAQARVRDPRLLNAKRRRRHLSHAALAEAASRLMRPGARVTGERGVSKSMVWALCAGTRRQTSFAKAEAIAEALGYEFEDLFEERFERAKA